VTTEPGPKLVELVDARLSAFETRYCTAYPAAMEILATDREGLTAYLRFPAEHHHRVRHSNFIERTFGETRRCAKVIGSFPNPAASAWCGPCSTHHGNYGPPLDRRHRRTYSATA
jgi:transposase-like protein